MESLEVEGWEVVAMLVAASRLKSDDRRPVPCTLYTISSHRESKSAPHAELLGEIGEIVLYARGSERRVVVGVAAWVATVTALSVAEAAAVVVVVVARAWVLLVGRVACCCCPLHAYTLPGVGVRAGERGRGRGWSRGRGRGQSRGSR